MGVIAQRSEIEKERGGFNFSIQGLYHAISVENRLLLNDVMQAREGVPMYNNIECILFPPPLLYDIYNIIINKGSREYIHLLCVS